jgi:UDPglucose--hexose-1-phosphate uridylyltransferase
MFDIKIHTHKRCNLLTGDWVLVSPHRMKRPWQGKEEALTPNTRPQYDPNCYLCPGNKRATDTSNPDYKEPFAFINDFSALTDDIPYGDFNQDNLLIAKSESGICKVICFSPRHDLTLAQMEVADITKVVKLWIEEFISLASHPDIRYIQIFENKGEIMGCSNPHPHGQIWASSSIPLEISKESKTQKEHFEKYKSSLLSDYLTLELKLRERVLLENEHFAVVVPFWAVWPYETLVISKRHVSAIDHFSENEQYALADIIMQLTIKYDNLFKTSFPYSAGMHQAPVNSGPQPYWHWHMHFYPPLLRSATVKKFMVGYEMLANPQRDITPEAAAEVLRSLPSEHYLQNQNHDEK